MTVGSWGGGGVCVDTMLVEVQVHVDVTIHWSCPRNTAFRPRDVEIYLPVVPGDFT